MMNWDNDNGGDGPDPRGMMLVPGYWFASHRADPRALALYRRHYSAEKNARYRKPGQLNFVAAGSPLVLLTAACDACFVWLRNTVERYDRQEGVCCALFRNEGPALSSTLIQEADELAWAKWPGERHFTYVDPNKTRRKRDPGRCFRRAGWVPCGYSKGGLLILERLPEVRAHGSVPMSGGEE